MAGNPTEAPSEFCLEMCDGRDRPGRPGARRAAAVDEHERSRDFLTPAEMETFLDEARRGRFGLRDHAMFLLAYRHGLRASELAGLRRADIDLAAARIWVNRLKNGLSTEQPLACDEVQALDSYLRTRRDQLPSVFVSSQNARFSRQALHYLVKQIGGRARLGHVHPHMLRHSSGYALADKGTDTRLIQDWLGHRDIRHTVHYTRTAAARFDGLWSGR